MNSVNFVCWFFNQFFGWLTQQEPNQYHISFNVYHKSLIGETICNLCSDDLGFKDVILNDGDGHTNSSVPLISSIMKNSKKKKTENSKK